MKEVDITDLSIKEIAENYLKGSKATIYKGDLVKLVGRARRKEAAQIKVEKSIIIRKTEGTATLVYKQQANGLYQMENTELYNSEEELNELVLNLEDLSLKKEANIIRIQIPNAEIVFGRKNMESNDFAMIKAAVYEGSGYINTLFNAQEEDVLIYE